MKFLWEKWAEEISGRLAEEAGNMVLCAYGSACCSPSQGVRGGHRSPGGHGLATGASHCGSTPLPHALYCVHIETSVEFLWENIDVWYGDKSTNITPSCNRAADKDRATSQYWTKINPKKLSLPNPIHGAANRVDPLGKARTKQRWRRATGRYLSIHGRAFSAPAELFCRGSIWQRRDEESNWTKPKTPFKIFWAQRVATHAAINLNPKFSYKSTWRYNCFSSQVAQWNYIMPW